MVYRGKNKYNLRKNAFTVLEVILVLIIMGILASFVLPKFSLSKKNAQQSKARSDIAAIRMGILLKRNKSLLSGNLGFSKTLDNSPSDSDNQPLFGDGVLAYPIYSVSLSNENKKSYSWSKLDSKRYRLWIEKIEDNFLFVDFTYNDGNGTFDCAVEYENCLKFTQ